METNPRLDGEQPTEECAITAQCNAQLFGGDAVAAIPLFFKALALGCKSFCEALHGAGYECVTLLKARSEERDQLADEVESLREQVRSVRH